MMFGIQLIKLDVECPSCAINCAIANRMQRAVTAAQKDIRRQQITDAAMRLFAERNYETTSMTEVARKASLAKGTVYLYFKTKEGLFLAIARQEIAKWLDAVDAGLQAIEEADSASVASVISDGLLIRPNLPRLMPSIHVMLEQSSDRETILDFRQMLHDRISRTGHLLEQALPHLEVGDGFPLMLDIYACTIGLQNMTQTTPLVEKLMRKHAPLRTLAINFEQRYVAMLTQLLS